MENISTNVQLFDTSSVLALLLIIILKKHVKIVQHSYTCVIFILALLLIYNKFK